ncbi:MAG: outer membrane beta-barrel protein [Beijerinckiaceae bacterium]|nr:outer membrane beta-barrel protein [Beijerinckiaceae bacterium]
MRKSLAITLTSVVLCAPAVAADMGYLPPPQYAIAQEQPTTIGNGWYLRGDAGWTRETPPVLTADTGLAAALGTKNGWAATIGAGYQFNDYFRTDLTLDYRNTLRANARSAVFDCVTNVVGVSNSSGTPIGINAVTGDCASTQQADFKRSSLLANAYIDLGTWTGLTPYVGAGVGITYGQANGTYNWITGNNGAVYAPDLQYPDGFPPTWVTGAGAPTAAPANFTFGQQNRRIDTKKSQTNFTWALMAGVAYAISPNAKLDFGYRYVNMGTFAPNSPKKDGQIQEFRMGLRYSPD